MNRILRKEYLEHLMENDMKNLRYSKTIGDFERVMADCAVRWYTIEDEFSSSSDLAYQARKNLRLAAFALKTYREI